MKIKLTAFLFVMMLTGYAVFAQDSVEMADTMRSEGKIYVVVVAASIVLAGILVYLVMLDRKISAMEKKLNKKN
jgi:hypothetical protein